MTAKQAENSYYNAIRKYENRWEITLDDFVGVYVERE